MEGVEKLRDYQIVSTIFRQMLTGNSMHKVATCSCHFQADRVEARAEGAERNGEADGQVEESGRRGGSRERGLETRGVETWRVVVNGGGLWPFYSFCVSALQSEWDGKGQTGKR